jgi:hypothetical protein
VAAPVIVGLVLASGRWLDWPAEADPAGHTTTSTPMHSASSTAARWLGVRALITGAVVRDAGKSTNLGPSSPAMTPRRQDEKQPYQRRRGECHASRPLPFNVERVRVRRSVLNASALGVQC